MEEYRRTKTTVSLINYHFVFCPRYRRKIFLDARVEQRFKEMVLEIGESQKIKMVCFGMRQRSCAHVSKCTTHIKSFRRNGKDKRNYIQTVA